ncbi:MAG TPA: ABC transporter substrate-binding protein [Chloroflexaceae bacterium]|nr:ABC transporter substrate-binding protein [Chloroflexaceae bacterium]
MNATRLLAALLLTLLLAACAGAPSAPQPPAAPDSGAAAEPARGGSVTRAITTEPTGLDPAGAQGSGQNVILPYLFDTLVAQDFENSIQPLLAERWEVSQDAKSIYFTLKQGLVFHDGTPLDAQAVVASFERLRSPELKSPMAASLKAVTAIEAVDARTVRFLFEQPSATFFSTITSPYASIVSPAAVAAAGEQFAQQPVGSGPFKLKSWEPGVAITLERNEAYAWAPPMVENRGAPYLDTVVFKVVPDAATQLAAFQAGEVDLMFLNQPDHITRMRGDANVVLEPVNFNGLAYLGFNCARAPFDDARVRQALAHAIDKVALVEAALGGEGAPAFAPMATTLLGFDAALQAGELAYDPARTAALLAEAGFAKGADGVWARDGAPLALTLLTFTRAPNQDVATVIQAQLKAVGVPVAITQLDAPAAGKAAVEGQYDLLVWRYDSNDSDVLNLNLNSQRIGSTNRVFYSNPEVDALLNAAAQELDAEARARLYVDAQRLIMADAPWQPLYTPVDMLALSPRLEGARLGAMGRVLLNDVTVK